MLGLEALNKPNLGRTLTMLKRPKVNRAPSWFSVLMVGVLQAPAFILMTIVLNYIVQLPQVPVVFGVVYLYGIVCWHLGHSDGKHATIVAMTQTTLDEIRVLND